MKTQVIQLNRNDDYISARDKMDWSQTGRILLVWPSSGHILNGPLELNLLKRRAGKLGAELMLISHDADVRFFARRLGVPVYDNLRAAREIHAQDGWHIKTDQLRTEHRPDLGYLRKLVHPPYQEREAAGMVRLICFVLSVLALFALGIFILPGATVTLKPIVKSQVLNLSLSIDPTRTEINLSTGTIPSEIREVAVEGRETMKVTGVVVIPDQFAHATLQFTNISDQKEIIPVGTIVTTLDENPVRFMISSEGDVEIGPGNSLVLDAQALVPGTTGNLPPESLVVIEGEIGADLVVTNPFVTEGGTDASVPAPSLQDSRRLHDSLVDKLSKTALTELQSLLSKDDALIAPSLKIMEVIEETYTPVVGEPGQYLNISLRVRFQSQVINGEVLRNFTNPILEAYELPGYEPIEGTINFIMLPLTTLGADGITHLRFQVQRELQTVISGSAVISSVKGLSIERATETLTNSFPIDESPQIKLSPSWWPRLPFVTMRMHVIQSKIQ